MELYKKATAIDIKIYGPDHTDVAIDYNNMAGLYKAQASSCEKPPSCLAVR